MNCSTFVAVFAHSLCFLMLQCVFVAKVDGFVLWRFACIECFGRCGFAQSQEAYDGAVNELFSTLDEIEDHLGSNRYLCGERLTLADVCLFTTLIRFDPVYNILFKCTKKKLVEYPNLYGYLRDLYQVLFFIGYSQIPKFWVWKWVSDSAFVVC